jgi:hypothetical protein
VIIASVEALKRGQFKATAIKVELEAQFNRLSDGCGDCDEGRVECNNCYGSGDFECDTCDGHGTNEVEHLGVTREVECSDCEGHGRYDCDDCDGGYYDCDNCDGGSTEWNDERVCQNWILRQLEPLGLSREVDGNFKVAGALKFAWFYNDHSVDSELTFTLSLENPENIFLLPNIIQVFKDFGAEIGNEFDVSGAGMHMALLNDENCLYPTSSTSEHRKRFHNFQRSMGLLLPALFFLGSSNENTRGLRYRQPQVASADDDRDYKYSAINYTRGAIEFRIFDTCYDKPDTILDNVVVMSNAMKYWTSIHKPTGLSKIAPRVHFGNDNNDKLDRFYKTVQHIDLLNKGLKMLKPSYYTVSQVKQQRNFHVTKTTVKNSVQRRRKEAVIEYKEYEQRFGWSILIKKHSYLANSLERNAGNHAVGDPLVLAEAERLAEERLQEYVKEKQSVDNYINQRITDFERNNRGQFLLES